MSGNSLPPRHEMPKGNGPRQTATIFNRFARRDPALYPLAAIVAAIAGVAGWTAMHKSSTHSPERKFVSTSFDPDKVGGPTQVAEWRYQYENRKTGESTTPSILSSTEVDASSVPANLRDKYLRRST